MELPPILLIIGSYFAMAGGVWALFDRANKAIKDETKIAISLWLIESNPTTGDSKWPGQFIKIFDSVFGEKHLSWKCFFRSCIASFIAITISILIFWVIRGSGVLFSPSGHVYWGSLIKIYIFAGLINFLPDYISLLETRYVLNWMKSSKSFLRIFGLLCLDLAVSILLIFGAFFIFSLFLNTSLWFPYSFDSFVYFIALIITLTKFFISGLSFSDPGGSIGIYIYSTLFTSVWIWLYGLSGLAIKIYNKAGRGIKWLNRFLDFENKPLPSLGFVSNLIILFIYLVGFGLFYDGNYL